MIHSYKGMLSLRHCDYSSQMLNDWIQMMATKAGDEECTRLYQLSDQVGEMIPWKEVSINSNLLDGWEPSAPDIVDYESVR